MTYTPSINDIDPPQAPYTPSINDIDPPVAPQQPSFLSQAASYAAPINAGATKFGANILSDIGRLTGNTGFANQMNQLSQNANQMYGVSDSLPSKLLEGTAQFAPYMLGAGAMPTSAALGRIPYLGRLLGQNPQAGAALGALYGATQSDPGQALHGAATNAAAGYGLGFVPGAISRALDLKDVLTGNAANKIYQSMSGGKTPDILNKNITDAIVNNYKSISGDIGNNYNDFKNLVANSGYATSGRPPIPGLESTENVQKFIKLSPDTNNLIGQLPFKSSGNASQSAIPQQMADLIKSAQRSPTFNNLHDLQSKLGELAADYKSGNAVQADRATARTLTAVRNNIKNDINSSFINNGDDHLANAYNSLSQAYRTQVAPYQNSPAIWRSIQGKDYPSNILNVLKRDNNAGDYETIRNHLSSDPTISRQVIAQALAKNAPKQFGNGQVVNQSKILNTYANLPQNIKNIAPNDVDDRMNQIANLSKWLGKSKLFVGGLAAAPIYHKIKEYL